MFSGTMYPGTPMATGRPLSASVFSMSRMESDSRNLSPYVFDSPGASSTPVGRFQGRAAFHSFSAYACVCSMPSRGPTLLLVPPLRTVRESFQLTRLKFPGTLRS